MRILVDTSVWVDYFNGHESPEALALDRYLETGIGVATCGVVIAELFQGFRSHKLVAYASSRFSDLLLLCPSEPDTYFASAQLYRALRKRGITVRSTIDCLIACIAAEQDALLLAKDRDIHDIVESRLCRVSAAPLVS